MHGKRKGILLVAALFAAGMMMQTAMAAETQKVAAGEAEAKQLLLLMDKDKNGKVSKEEFMSFMEAEFNRLDVNKDGELDVQELMGLRVSPKHPGGTGSR